MVKTFLTQPLRSARFSGNAAPARPLPAARKSLPLASHIFAPPLRPSEISHVDPAALKVAAEILPLPTETSKPPRPINLAALIAGAATLLTPALAFAGTVGGALTSIGPVGLLLSGVGLVYTARFLIKTSREIKAGNYQSPASTFVGNNPSIKKLLKYKIAPAFGLLVAGGLFMNFSPLLSLALGWSFDALTMGAFCGVVGYAALKFAISSIRDFSRWRNFKILYEQRNVVQPKLIPQLITNFLGNFALASQVVLMAHFSKIFTTQLVGMLLNFTSNLANFSAAGLTAAGLGQAVAIASAALGLYQFVIGARRARVSLPLEKHPSILAATTKGAILGAALGAGIYLGGGSLVATVFVTFLVSLAFGHGALHSIRSQFGGLRQKDKIFPIFDLKSTYEAVRGVKGAFRTVFKPSVDMVDPLVSSYVMAFVTEGANWVLNAISGCYGSIDYKKALQLIDQLLNKDTALLRKIIRDGYQRLKKSSDSREIALIAAETYDNIAKFMETEIAPGDLAARSGGLPYLKNGMFSSGLPGSKLSRSDQDLRVHGEHIRFAAKLYLAEARRLRKMAETTAGKMAAESLKEKLTLRLEALHRRAFPHCDSHPGRFFTNFLPDSYNAKQFVIDLCSQVMADFVGAFDVVVRNPEGNLEIWLVPMKVVKDVDPNYRKALTLEVGDDSKEDPRFSWYERGTEDIGDSLCEIAYIDNSAHYARHRGDVNHYPTAENLAPPRLAADEYYDVVYKNDARLRIFGNGRHEVIGELPPGAAALIMLPGTDRHKFLGMEKVPYPNGWGGNFTDDQYLAPRWRFMYPTEYTSVSDADQMDRAVTNLRLFHTRSNPHLRVMMARVRKEKLPFSKDMLESPRDTFLEAGIANVWMVLKLKMKDGKELYMPLNMNKENERTFGGDLWKYIDETQPVRIENSKLVITYREEARKDPAFRRAQRAIERVAIPLEMRELEGEIAEVRIDPIRYGETGGPIPVVDAIFVRRNSQDKVADRHFSKSMSDRLAQMIIAGTTALLTEKDLEHYSLVIGDKRVKESRAWVDKSGLVHLAMSEKEHEEFKPWIPRSFGLRQPAYDRANSELTLPITHFIALCNNAYGEFAYRRFLPCAYYPNYFDPAEISRANL